MSQEILNELEQDCLQELVNMSYGKATARIAEVLNAFATMKVPFISVLSKDELYDRLKGACTQSSKCYLMMQLFKGEFDGEAIFFLSEDSALNLVDHLKESDEENNVKDVVMELTNMVTSSLVGEFAKLLGAEVFFDEPVVEVLCLKTPCEVLKVKYDYIMLINTVMEFEEQNIHGEVYLMMHEKTFKWLKSSLSPLVEKFYG
jgi:chemotaxis protein CheC